MDIYFDEKNNPWLEISVRSTFKLDIKCLIDTGFSGGIALPRYYENLFERKIPLYTENYEFANGEKKVFNIYGVTAKFQKKTIDTKVMFIDSNIPLVGISFLRHFLFSMDIPRNAISLSNFMKEIK